MMAKTMMTTMKITPTYRIVARLARLTVIATVAMDMDRQAKMDVISMTIALYHRASTTGNGPALELHPFQPRRYLADQPHTLCGRLSLQLAPGRRGTTCPS